MKNFTKARQELVAAGWRRCDRHNRELWMPPAGPGWRAGAVSFATARRHHLKATTSGALDECAEPLLAPLRGPEP